MSLTEGYHVLARAREIYGNKNQILVSMEELAELITVLAKYPRYDKHNEAVSALYHRVVDEYADVLVVLDHVKAIFNLDDTDILRSVDKKMRRLEGWLNNSNSIQYTAEHREDPDEQEES